MGAIGVQDVTGYTASRSTQSNVAYQLRVFYRITARSGTSVTFDLDVHVHYPDKWSSNGAWVRYNGNQRRCNPNITSSRYDWYASSQSTSRSGYWLTGQTKSVSATATSTTVTIGFSNTGWAAGTYYDQNLTINFPIGWTAVGKPGTISYGSYWNESSVNFSWGAASNGTNNAVSGYHVYIDRSSNNSTWTNVVSVDVGASTRSRSYTFGSADGRGYYYRCNVNTRAPYGNSAQTMGPTARRNLASNAPTINSPANNATIVPNVNIVFNAATDPGGLVTPDGKIHYRYKIKYGSNFGSTATGGYSASTTHTPSWTNYVGQTVRILGQTGDGWTDSAEGAYRTVKVGSSMTVGSPLGTTSLALRAATGLTIPRAYVNSNYALFNVTETIRLQYSTNNSTWYTIGSAVTRSSSGALTSTTSFSNILALVYNHNSSLFLNAKGQQTIYFRTTHTAGHLSANSATRSLTYTAPEVSLYISAADGSSTLKFPMNNTIPVTNSTFTIMRSVANWIAGNTGLLTVQAKNVTSSTWSDVASYTMTGNSMNVASNISLSTLGIGRGQTYEIRGKLTLTSATSPIEIFVGNINWNTSNQATADKNRIEYRAIPNLYTTITSTQNSFIRNGVLPNRASISYRIYWDSSKRYVINNQRMYVTDNNVLSTITGPTYQLLTRAGSSGSDDYVEYTSAYTELADTPESDKGWKVMRGIVTTGTVYAASPSSKVRGNSTSIDIERNFIISECYRSSATATAPTNSETYRSTYTQTLIVRQTANTTCPPVFDSGTVTIKRAEGL